MIDNPPKRTKSNPYALQSATELSQRLNIIISKKQKLPHPDAHARPRRERRPTKHIMDEELPRAHVKRLVKTKLSTLDNVDAKGQSFEPNIQKEALSAYGECAKIFIHYITATANDISRDHKRSTISAEDVMSAIEECDFGELAGEVRATLQSFQTAKRAKKSSAGPSGGEKTGEGDEDKEDDDDDDEEDAEDGEGGAEDGSAGGDA
jgi:DNA polymerase epsilon subunit 3